MSCISAKRRRSPLGRRFQSILTSVVPVLLACTALLLALLSLRWPLVHDLPIMLYEGFLMVDCGKVPYRDFFDMNPPGTPLLYAFIHLVTDGRDLPLRIMDVSLVLAVAGLTLLILRHHGWRAGLLASSSFVLVYLGGGPPQALQRESFCVLFFAISAALFFNSKEPAVPSWKFLVAGLCAGCAMTMKPPTLLLWMPLLLFFCFRNVAAYRSSTRGPLWNLARRMVLFSAGFAAPIAATLAYLYVNGGLSAYLGVANDYYPLYTQISGTGEMHHTGIVALLKRYYFLTFPQLAKMPVSLLAFVGLSTVVLGCRPVKKQEFFLFASLVCCALLYIPISGKNWSYHHIPLLYTLSLCAGLSATFRTWVRGAVGHSLVMLMAGLTLFPLNQLDTELWMWRRGEIASVRDGVVDLVEAQLRKNATPGGGVLPLDVTGGAIHALYRARIPLQGRFIYDFHFYHHVDHPYIRGLRKDFIAAATNPPPELILQFSSWRPNGRTCSEEFPELQDLLRNYEPLVQTNKAAVLRYVGDKREEISPPRP